MNRLEAVSARPFDVGSAFQQEVNEVEAVHFNGDVQRPAAPCLIGHDPCHVHKRRILVEQVGHTRYVPGFHGLADHVAPRLNALMALGYGNFEQLRGLLVAPVPRRL